MSEEKKRNIYFRNWMSVIGGILSVILFAVILFLFVLDFLDKGLNPYLGIFTYVVVPVFLVISLLMIPIGAWRERARFKKLGHVQQFPQIDFNNPTHQKIAFAAWGVVTLFLLFSMVGAYRAYEFSESVTFCGRTCHGVMGPEYIAYKNSPHAHVACVECHIGPGIDWYIRSKPSGARQAYLTLTNRFNRPIPTPIKTLRPARETCEHCHWPEQFYGDKEVNHKYFLPDETNTEWKARLLVHVGGAKPRYGQGEGIHWHMKVNNQVYYIATDEKKENIPWVRQINPDGKEEIFVEEKSGYSASNPPKGEIKLMDCMDCHNRPSHHFKAPSESVNEAMGFGQIDSSLPYIKREAVKALVGNYKSNSEAKAEIRKRLETFYREKYPAIWESKGKELQSSIDRVINIYNVNFFPEMKTSWKVHPNNIGHFISTGCFRCHDDKHKTAEGKVIRKDCAMCHAIIEQGKPELLETAVAGVEFKHPEDIGEEWKETKCSDCHTGELA
ncbi:MAG: cytochrome C [Candidatus Omnitrophica bacterium]|nr:cytochrome C [Candidatus Omnitrophota bacterium]